MPATGARDVEMAEGPLSTRPMAAPLTQTAPPPAEGRASAERSADPDKGKCARTIVQNRGFIFVLLLGLGFSLVGHELWILFNVPDHPGNDIMDRCMAFILVLFVIEAVLKLRASPQYIGSFFFWVDILSCISVVLEASFFDNAGRSILANVLKDEPRSKRAAAFTAVRRLFRTARLAKLLKIMSFFDPSRSQRDDQEDLVAQHMMRMLSTKVPFLALLVMVVMPLVNMKGYWYVPRHSMDVWGHWAEADYQRAYAALANDPSLESTDIFQNTLKAMNEYYDNIQYHPFKIEGFPEQVRVGGRDATIISGPVFAHRKEPPRKEFVMVQAVPRCLVPRPACNATGTGAQGPPAILFDLRAMVIAEACKHILMISCAVAMIVVMSRDMGKTLEVMLSIEKVANANLSQFALIGNIFDDLGITNLSAEDRNVVIEMMELGGRGQGEAAVSRNRVISAGKALRPEELVVDSLPVAPEVLNSWDLDVLDLDAEGRHKVILYIFFDSSIGRSTGRSFTDLETFNSFCGEAHKGYREDNPYHNYIHACDVCHTVYRLLCETHCKQCLSPIEQYALLVSAICHDIGHGGLTNPFLVETGNELALRYNDTSPLESMHCATLFSICGAQKATNVFQRLSNDEYRLARKTCIASILHTDMAHHFEMVKHLGMRYEVASKLCDEQAAASALLPEYEAEVLKKEPALLHQLLLHLADVSNPLKPWKVCQAWAWRVLDEFFAQGDEEQRLGIPVGMLNDRAKVNKPGSQHGFIMFVVSPLVMGAVKILHPLHPMATQMAGNLGSWRECWIQDASPPQEEAAKRAADVKKVHEEAERLSKRGQKKGAAAKKRGSRH